MLTRDPFCHPWKRTARVLAEARRRRFSITLAVDERSCADCCERAKEYEPIWFTPPHDYCEPVMDEMVHRSKEPMALLVSDDEEPSARLWLFAQQPPVRMSWTVRLITPTPNGRLYKPGMEVQLRLIHTPSWHWVGDIGGHDEHGGRVGASQLVLWHFATFAPREFRDRKFDGYRAGNALSETDWEIYARRHNYEDWPDQVVAMPKDLKAQYPPA
jgi:hypothetical protein